MLPNGFSSISFFCSSHKKALAAASAWPASPGMPPRPSPRPGQSPDHKSSQIAAPHHSRVLPARSWAGAIPTLLTQEAFEILCKSCPLNGIPGPDMSPLERFLGCVFMKRQLQRMVKESVSFKFNFNLKILIFIIFISFTELCTITDR